MKPKLIAQGAEAKILLDKKKNIIIKDRIKKSYRIPELDKKIRKTRTKAETKLLLKASQIINSPKLKESKEFDQIKMPFIDGKKISEHLDDFSLAKQKQILKQIGKSVAKLHKENIIHGDLTTSNMILVESDQNINNFKKLLEKVKKLKLPQNEYVIFGSAPLAIRNLRDTNDIDLLVSKKIFDEYKKKSDWKFKKFKRKNQEIEILEKGDIEMFYKWGPGKWDSKKIINNSEIINNIPFANLDDFIKWKKISGREKDKKDLGLIKKYLLTNPQRSDLTKSVAKQSIASNSEPIIYLIDFGLGFQNAKYEDKAVDIHLLKQALEAKHFKHWKTLYKEFEKAYSSTNKLEAKKILAQLIKVEKRGRYKS